MSRSKKRKKTPPMKNRGAKLLETRATEQNPLERATLAQETPVAPTPHQGNCARSIEASTLLGQVVVRTATYVKEENNHTTLRQHGCKDARDDQAHDFETARMQGRQRLPGQPAARPDCRWPSVGQPASSRPAPALHQPAGQ